MKAPLRIGVIGVGHLGSRHAQIYAAMPGVHLAAVCDTNVYRAKKVARSLKCEAVGDFRQLIGKIDAASLVVPTSLHAAIGEPLLRQGVHLLVEKPITTRLSEADALIRAARKRDCVLQVGHVERFNAAIHAARKYLNQPRFIEVDRLSPYPFRGTDVSVILDVMIHDLDLIQWLVGAKVRRIDAVGMRVLSPSEDIANARLTFAGGCIANLTASRINDEALRRIRVFQEDCYLSIDYRAQSVELVRKRNRAIHRIHLPVNKRPPLQDEMAAFVRSVKRAEPPIVPGEDGRSALALALQIEQAMRRHHPRRSQTLFPLRKAPDTS